MRNATKDIKEFRAILSATAEHIDAIHVYKELLDNRNPDWGVDGLAKSYAIFKKAFDEVDEKLRNFESRKSSVWKCLAWWFEEKDLNAGMVRVKSQMQQYTAVQLGYLSLYVYPINV